MPVDKPYVTRYHLIVVRHEDTGMIVLSDVPNILASIPVYAINNNCVQDQYWRVRELYDLAMHSSNSTDPVSMYLLIALDGLQSWIDHAKSLLPK